MAQVGISEFTFGYAFLYEQTHANWGNLQAAPILPSLQQEEEQGWDAHLPLHATDFYYQFKLTDYLSRSNASFIRDHTYAGPYYRLAFHRRNNNQQHKRLRDHSLTNPNTYYVAPEFNAADDFHAAFLAQQLTNRSRLIPLPDCDDINDSDQHWITFQPNQVGWIQHSERKTHDRSYSGSEIQKVYRETHDHWKPVTKAYATELFEKTAHVVRKVREREEPEAMAPALPLLDFNPNQMERRDVLIRTSQILSVVLGVTLVLVGTKE
jgi:hypothetical protein